MSVFTEAVYGAAENIRERRGDYLADLEWLVELALESEFGR
jgi:hypothetical protein